MLFYLGTDHHDLEPEVENIPAEAAVDMSAEKEMIPKMEATRKSSNPKRKSEPKYTDFSMPFDETISSSISN